MGLFLSKYRKNVTVTLIDNIRAFFASIRIDFFKNWAKVKNLSNTNYLLGLYHLEQGNIFDAKLRFQFTLRLNPDFSLAYYHLARIYIYNLEFNLSKAELEKCLSYNPENISAKYRLDYLNRENITIIPAQVIREDFNCLAKNYENYMLNQVFYQAPDLTCQYLQEYLEAVNFNFVSENKLLDLGCGSGVFGAAIVEKFDRFIIDGIDLSPKMVDLTSQLQSLNDKPVYRNLFASDFHDLTNIVHKYDFISAILSFNYTLDFEIKVIMHILKFFYVL